MVSPYSPKADGDANSPRAQKGKDALDRYAVLKKELDAIVAELDKLIGK